MEPMMEMDMGMPDIDIGIWKELLDSRLIYSNVLKSFVEIILSF